MKEPLSLQKWKSLLVTLLGAFLEDEGSVSFLADINLPVHNYLQGNFRVKTLG